MPPSEVIIIFFFELNGNTGPYFAYHRGTKNVSPSPTVTGIAHIKKKDCFMTDNFFSICIDISVSMLTVR